MEDVERIKDRVRAQFGAAADAYVRSATHRIGDDLARLVALAELTPETVALDVATGGGHTALALAPHVRQVIASDLTPAMLEQARAFLTAQGVTNVEFRVADAEELPFPDASFDLVTCRIAPHHFADVQRAVHETARVLRPGGLFLLIDSVSPEDPELDAFLNELERRRDPSHVRSYRRSEWCRFLEAAGFAVEAMETFPKRHDFADWTGRSRLSPEDRAALEAWVLAAPPACREHFRVEVVDGRVVAHTDEKALFKARKIAPGA
ncbi:MAG: methyltransferase domain-containing protein [Sphaerobacter sp.]|nr:methyltransferase domain-containing protein [Sphaerobacter sp.]